MTAKGFERVAAPASESVLIDLDDRDRSVALPRRARRRMPRLAAAVTLAALAMLAPTSSQRANPVIAPALWRAPVAADFVIDNDRVYLISRPGDGTGDGNGVTALSAGTGATLWRVSSQYPVMDVAVLSGGILAISSQSEFTGVPGSPLERPMVDVVDADGRLLAEFPGVLRAVVPGTDILVVGQAPAVGQARFNGNLLCEETSDCTDLVGVSARTGLEIWRLPADYDTEPIWGWRSTLPQGVDELGVVDSRGHVTLYDPASGRAIQDISIPNWEAALSPAEAIASRQVMLMGGVVLTVSRDVDDVGIVRAATLAATNIHSGQVWRTSVAVPDGLGRNDIFYVFECGPWLCLWEESQTTIFDPATGAAVRRLPELLNWVVVVEDLVAHSNDDPPGLTMMNPVTGEIGDSLPGLLEAIERPGGLPLFVVPRTRGPGSFVYEVSRAGEFSLMTTIEMVRFCKAAADILVCSVGPEQSDSPPDATMAWRLPTATTS